MLLQVVASFFVVAAIAVLVLPAGWLYRLLLRRASTSALYAYGLGYDRRVQVLLQGVRDFPGTVVADDSQRELQKIRKGRSVTILLVELMRRNLYDGLVFEHLVALNRDP